MVSIPVTAPSGSSVRSSQTEMSQDTHPHPLRTDLWVYMREDLDGHSESH